MSPLSQQWRWVASCVGTPNDWWFGHSSSARTAIPQQAKDLCRDCPALASCREYAIRHEEYGFQGGMTEKERKSIRKKRGIQLQSKPVI